MIEMMKPSLDSQLSFKEGFCGSLSNSVDEEF